MAVTVQEIRAKDLVAGQSPLQVFAPLEALIAAQGFVVLMGVDLTSMTLLHYAEQKAGRRLFRRWANGPDGEPMEVETGGCSEGFERLAPLLSSIERRIQVGQSVWFFLRRIRLRSHSKPFGKIQRSLIVVMKTAGDVAMR